MTSNLSLREVLSKAPDIHVFDRNGVKVLKPKMEGAKYKDKPLSRDSISGDGTRQKPLTHRASMDVNPHNVIVDLWLQSLSLIPQHTGQVFIQVNDWVLRVEPRGVTSVDRHFTKLLPE